tara:strand:- start:30 stop:3269 length:3240 start_codon:yes stop_codon:yes gene_type:complete
MDLVSQNLLMTSGGKKDPTYVEDVFSTYLWRGDGQSGRPISNGIKLSNNNTGNSVYLNGTDSYLSIPSSSDFAFGTDDFTWEGWFYINDNGSYLINFGADVGNLTYYTYGSATRRFQYYNDSSGHQNSDTTVLSLSTWYHLAAARSSGTTKVFINGIEKMSFTDNKNYGAEACYLGATSVGGSLFTGNMSNVRIVKGQALYTSSFTPSTQALTTTSQGATASNVKLLCCQSSTSPTAAAKSPSGITAHITPESQGFGPFTANDGEGGLAWIKSRTSGNVNVLFDTVRGANQRLRSDSNLAQNNADLLQPSFTNSGFTVGSGNEVNGSGNDYTSWTFRKQKGFFDIVEFTGDGTSSQVIPHNLGSVPGCIMIKTKDLADDWKVYHRGLNDGVTPEKWLVKLNDTQTASEYTEWWNNTAPTATNFTVGEWNNASGWEFIAYVFAGGPSTAATAPSLSFSGSNYLQVASSSDFAYGTGDFTMECWAKSTSNPAERILISNGTDYGYIGIYSQGGRTSVQYVAKTTTPHLMSDGFSVARNQWFHVAVSRNSGVSRLFLNGQLCNTPASDPHNYPAGVVDIGRSSTSPNNPWVGNISNVRIVKGTGLYTSSFTPSTEPLKNVSGTVLLCCNNSSPTGATVTPGTITNNNSVTASTDTPFDDPEGYKFGEEGDQNLIKCGSFTTDSTNGSYLDLPWEPQWILYKHYSANVNWHIIDCMRGWSADGGVEMLYPNLVNAGSYTSNGYEELLRNTLKWQGYGNNYDFMYIAIRRPEPLVSKSLEVATKVFDMLPSPPAPPTGYPWYRPVEFPVDMSISRSVISSHSWDTGARIIEGRRLQLDNYDADTSGTYNFYDYQDGWNPYTGSIAGHVSWMWKRHAGFDVVPYIGNGQSGRQVKHSLGRVPEMMWVKSRDSSGNDADWQVYHKGLGQTDNDPEGWNLRLNTNQAENWNNFGRWNKTLPASTHFTVGNYQGVNKNNDNMIAMLFASVEGISKCGYYTGNGTGQTITAGFQPRFLFIKRTDSSGNWFVLDTVRGWGGGNDKYLKFNDTSDQIDHDFGAPTSTGFTLTANTGGYNANGGKYIYYAHA